MEQFWEVLDGDWGERRKLWLVLREVVVEEVFTVAEQDPTISSALAHMLLVEAAARHTSIQHSGYFLGLRASMEVAHGQQVELQVSLTFIFVRLATLVRQEHPTSVPLVHFVHADL